MNTDDWQGYEKWISEGGIPFPLIFNYCPKCGKILSEEKTYHWSHDLSYKTGYTLVSKCVFCNYSEVYHDVE